MCEHPTVFKWISFGSRDFTSLSKCGTLDDVLVDLRDLLAVTNLFSHSALLKPSRGCLALLQ